MDGYQIFIFQGIFMNFQRTRAAEIDNTERFDDIQDFPDAVKLRTWPVIDQITDGYMIVGSVMIGSYNRKAVKAIRKLVFLFSGAVRAFVIIAV
jgi:hypothetical protein